MDNFKRTFQNLTVQICLIVLISRACIFFFGMWGHQVFPEYIYHQNIDGSVTETISNIDKGNSLMDVFGKFDSGYYMQIANSGYQVTDNTNEAKKVWAFMPLYPITTKVVSIFSSDQNTLFTIGIVLSNVLFLASCIFIKQLLSLFKKEKYTLKTILLLCFFPGSIYFSFFYTESLFLFLSILAAIFIKKKNWIVATLCIGLLGITRKTGLLFLVPFIIEYFRFNNIKNISNIFKVLGYLCLQLLPFLIFIQFLGNISQNINSVFAIQSLWSKIPVVPFSGIYHMLVDFRFTTIFQVGLCFVAGFVLWKSKKLLPKEYLLYCGISIIAFLSTGEVASIIRYLAILFPLYFAIAELIKKRIVFEIILVLFSIMQTFLLILFVSGYSFAT